MARSSARRSCAPRIRPPPSARSSRPVAQPDDPANVARRPFVKICGVTDADGVLAAVRAGADAIGLNLVAGHAARARARRGGGARPARPDVPAPAGRPPARRRDHRRRVARDAWTRIVAALDPDVVQLSGDESVAAARAIPRRTWKVLHLPADGAAAARRRSSPTSCRAAVPTSTAGVERLLLDTAGGPHPGGTGTRAAERLAAAVAREVPVTLAGGLDPANVAGRAARDPGRRRRRRVRRRAARASPANGRARTRSASRCSSSAPARPATTGRTSPSARPPSTPACSMPTAPAAGGWSATSAAATCPRR